jgi:hypothetical protein
MQIIVDEGNANLKNLKIRIATRSTYPINGVDEVLFRSTDWMDMRNQTITHYANILHDLYVEVKIGRTVDRYVFYCVDERVSNGMKPLLISMDSNGVINIKYGVMIPDIYDGSICNMCILS